MTVICMFDQRYCIGLPLKYFWFYISLFIILKFLLTKMAEYCFIITDVRYHLALYFARKECIIFPVTDAFILTSCGYIERNLKLKFYWYLYNVEAFLQFFAISIYFFYNFKHSLLSNKHNTKPIPVS